MLTLTAENLTAENFAPYGDVIESGESALSSMNDARFERFDDLMAIDVSGKVAVGVVRARAATSLPHVFDTIERHPLGSQAFIPLSPFQFLVVVAPAGEAAKAEDLHAFISNGEQGINYRRGTWHMPLIALAEGQRFLLIDRSEQADNCDFQTLGTRVQLVSRAI